MIREVKVLVSFSLPKVEQHNLKFMMETDLIYKHFIHELSKEEIILLEKTKNDYINQYNSHGGF